MFSWCVYAFLLLGVYPLVVWEKQHANCLVNDYIANYMLDPFFIGYSQAFEGWCFVLISLVLMFVSKRKLLMFIIIGILCFLVTTLLKDIVFGNIPRPTKAFPLDSYTHILQDINVYKENYTFPSGHSMTAFSVMALFASFTKKQWLAVVYFFIALGAAFSRIYLLQHFFVDVYVGSLLGFLIAIVTLFFFEKKFSVEDVPLVRIR